MKKNICGSNKFGFTLVEILIAAGVFALFSTALFSFYNMGGKMFNSGTWRQTTQKKAEQFAYMLEKRINRASIPIIVENNALQKGSAVFAYKSGLCNTPSDKKTKELLVFPVCASAINNKKGVVMYHILRAVPQDSTHYKLEFHATTNLTNLQNLAPNSKAITFASVNGTLPNTKFGGSPSDYELGSNNYKITLDDVRSLNVEIATATPELGSNNSTIQILHITANCSYPKNNNASMTFDFTGYIDSALELRKIVQ